jgi:Gti1/Pac2 family transcription factor
MTSSSSLLAPTYYGYIASTQDGLLLFEACLSGALKHVSRRPNDRERARLIRSGNVFIYEEHLSGIKRWTDGIPWSPSRNLGDFLVYRELERPFVHGDKRAMKSGKGYPRISSVGVLCDGAASDFDPRSPNSLMRKDTEYSLIGSLVDSYGFIEGGLVKKTFSITIEEVSHHLVAYYTIADVMKNKLTTPSNDPSFQNITPRPDLTAKRNFNTQLTSERQSTMPTTEDL